MKKLLATSALIGAATLFAGAAVAAGPVVTVGGQADFQAGFADQKAAYETGVNSRDNKFKNDTKVNVKAEGKADNGLVYGAVIELQADVSESANNSGFNADKTFIYLQADFGRVELGANSDATEALRVDASTFARAAGGIGGDFYQFLNVAGVGNGQFIVNSQLPTEHGTLGGRDQSKRDANKVTYYSPRFSGLQLGVSYTPDQGDIGSAAGFSGENNGDQKNVIGAGLNYSAQYNELGLAASLTGEFGDAEDATDRDLGAYAAGLNLSYRGLTVGGSYGDWRKSTQSKAANADADYWTLGAALEQGPAGLSVTYLDSTYGQNDFQNVSVGVDYKLAPGLTPYVEVNFFDIDPAGTAAKNSGTLFVVGTGLNF